MATDQEMLDRIAKLSTAIEQQKSIRGRGEYTPRGRGRALSFRGAPLAYRGRGGNMSLSKAPVRPTYYPVNKPYTRPPPPPQVINTPAPVSHHRTLVLNGPPPTTTTFRPPSTSQHRKLIINHKGNSTTNNTMIKSIDSTTGRKQVSIDGVDFVVKGKKLIRKDLFDSNTTLSKFMATSNAPKVLVRKTLKSSKRRDKNQNMVLGKIPTKHIRRKKIERSQGGNMVFTRGPEGYVRQGRSGKSLVLNTQRTVKKPRYCGFFTRYGKCPNATHCPFIHDPNRRAVCPRFLQNRCKKPVCKLSHIPNPNNMPHCVHFQKGLCKNDPCLYIHVRVSSDAPVCKAFAMEGYCQKGLECQEKHVHVCPEFAETGKCSNANCRLPHVAKRTAEKNASAGIIRLGSWVSPQYFHAQKMAKAEKRKAIEEAAASKVWIKPVEEPSKEQVREKEENDGFVRLFDDSDEDDGWSQFEREDTEDIKSLRFNDEEEEEEEEEEVDNEEEEEEEEDMEEDSGSDEDSDVEEVYEEVSDDNMSDEE